MKVRTAVRIALAVTLTSSLVALPHQAQAQVDTGTTSFDVNGLKVILRRNTANDVVAANVYLLGGSQQLTPATQGIEAFLLTASELGTKMFPHDAVRRITAQLGSNIIIAPRDDWTVFGFTTIRSSFDSTWTILADRLMAPTLDSVDVERVRERMLSRIRLADNTPDPLVNKLADSLAYVGHVYGFSPEGNESSLQSITLGALRNYQATQMVTSRMLVVVVGNIDRARLEPLVQSTLAQLPRGNYTWSPPRQPPPLGRALVFCVGQLPTNNML
jgi:zinc protease